MSSILITGGTGSLGSAIVRRILGEPGWTRVIVLSRDDHKQADLRASLPEAARDRLRLFVGDVRDLDRLRLAFDGVDSVIHTAALKRVEIAEYNPLEYTATNVTGTNNVLRAARDSGVARVLFVSTDKAVNAITTYGRTKALAESSVIAADQSYSRPVSHCAVVRYGNVIGSRGSVVPLWVSQRASGRVTVTDPAMTRFLITLDQAVTFVLSSLDRMRGGEIFVPKLPSCRMDALASAVAPWCTQEIIGVRGEEKLHEELLTEYETRRAQDVGDRFVVWPNGTDLRMVTNKVPTCFRYQSDGVAMTAGDLSALLVAAGVLSGTRAA